MLYGFLEVFVVAQLYRYHAVSSRMERQQTRWIVFGVTVAVLIEFAYTLGSDLFPSFFSTGSLADLILSPIVTGLPILIPLSFGFAIFRYRLWDIDIIICQVPSAIRAAWHRLLPTLPASCHFLSVPPSSYEVP